MVEVFKTNVSDKLQVKIVSDTLTAIFPDYVVNFDLEDCDKIMRIRCKHEVDSARIIKALKALGFEATVLQVN